MRSLTLSAIRYQQDTTESRVPISTTVTRFRQQAALTTKAFCHHYTELSSTKQHIQSSSAIHNTEFPLTRGGIFLGFVLTFRERSVIISVMTFNSGGSSITMDGDSDTCNCDRSTNILNISGISTPCLGLGMLFCAYFSTRNVGGNAV